MGSRILIIFDNPVSTYYAGDAVTGKVIVKLDAVERIRYISARFKGEANVKWTKQKSQNVDGKNEMVNVDYKGHEDYFEATYYLVGGPSQLFILPPGEHVYNFAATLPPHLPSSFEGKHGHIRYSVKIKIKRPHTSDYENKAIFTVLSHFDLNKNPALKEPASVTKEKSLCCLCCTSGPLILVAGVPTTGFVCGQDIPITVDIENGTNKKVKNVICSLIQTVCFTVGMPEKMTATTRDKVKSITFEPVDVHDSKTWTKKLKIPTLPPSKLDYCDIIDVKYCLDVEVVIDGPHINLHVSIPITLGTIPLLIYVPSAPYLHQQLEHSNGPYNPTIAAHRSAGQQHIVPHNPYQEVPPPAFEECQYGANDFHSTQDVNKFIPRYPAYNLHIQS